VTAGTDAEPTAGTRAVDVLGRKGYRYQAMSRIEDVPIYEQRDEQVSAKLFNLWRRARQRLTFPLRLDITELKGIAMIVEDRAWVCVNTRQNDLPVIAWVDFDFHGRAALHEPVACKLNYYHYAASRLHGGVLQALERELQQRLDERG